MRRQKATALKYEFPTARASFNRKGKIQIRNYPRKIANPERLQTLNSQNFSHKTSNDTKRRALKITPDILRQAILDEVLVLVLVEAHVNNVIPDLGPRLKIIHHVL